MPMRKLNEVIKLIINIVNIKLKLKKFIVNKIWNINGNIDGIKLRGKPYEKPS